MLTVTCPHCQASLNIKDHMAGKQIACPRCRQAFQIGPAPVQEVMPFEMPPEREPREAASLPTSVRVAAWLIIIFLSMFFLSDLLRFLTTLIDRASR